MKPSSMQEGAYPPSLSGGEGVLLLQESVREGLGDMGSGQATPTHNIQTNVTEVSTVYHTGGFRRNVIHF